MIKIETDRLTIREPVPSDIDDWHRLLSDSDTMYFLPDIMTNTLDESRQNLDIAISESKNPNRTKYFLTIADKKTGTFMGNIGYTVLQKAPPGKIVEVGYFTLSQYHGRGYATEALSAIICFAFNEGDVFRIMATCLSENHPSERVMQKNGFIKEAEHKSFTWHDGRMKDRVEYRLLKDEWLSLQRA